MRIMKLSGWQIFFLVSLAESERWLLLGGYTGFEGEEGTAVRDEVELIELTEPDNFKRRSNWCQGVFPSSSDSLDGATIDMIDTFTYMEGLEGDSKFSSAHNSFIYERALVCGGADNYYRITNICR